MPEKMIDKKEIITLLNTAKGQTEGIIKMVKRNRKPSTINAQILSASAVLNSANAKVIAAQINKCFEVAVETQDLEIREQKVAELRKLLKKLT